VIVLGLDTATSATVAGVLAEDGTVYEVRDDPEPGARPAHASRLLGAAEEALAAAGVGWDQVARLAVGIGPGSFTGLRIGIATARALAQARRIPVTGVSTLEALARGAGPRAADAARPAHAEPAPAGRAPAHAEPALVLAVLDARRGEAFAAAWEGGALVLGPAALSPDALADRVRALGSTPLAVGDGAVRFRGPLEAAGARVPPDEAGVHRLRAEHVCRLGAEGTPTDRDALLPDYLREPDAVPRPR
jgi:tRNA threonylcarbamoyladenosine biosynthesis protein TsaB